MITAGGAIAAGAIMVALDDRLSAQLKRIVAGDPAGELSQASLYVQRGARMFMENVEVYHNDHAGLALFAFVAVVLTVVMFRS
jgi:hypothetical protein